MSIRTTACTMRRAGYCPRAFAQESKRPSIALPRLGQKLSQPRDTHRTLPVQGGKIGSLQLSRAPFFSLAGTQKDAGVKGFDGVMPTGLFRPSTSTTPITLPS
jgi:hypothetical protein